MAESLRVLFVEDSADDVLMLERELHSAGYQPKGRRVRNEAEFLAALTDPPDVVLADCTLQHFCSATVLRLLRERSLDIPLLLLFGPADDASAAAALRLGADDFLCKDRLARLGPAVRKTLEMRRLRGENDLLRAVAEGIADAVFVKDRDGRYLMINAAGAKIVGKPVEEILGKNDSSHFSSEFAQRLMDDDRKVMESGKGQTYDTVRTAASGVQHIRASKAPYRDRDGNIIGVIGISRDVTESRQAEEALRRSREQHEVILRGVVEGIALHDRTGQMTYANDALAQMLWFPSAGELLATPAQEIFDRYDIMDEQGKPLAPDKLPGARVLTGEPEAEALIQWRVRATGDRCWAIAKSKAIFDDKGQLQYVVNFFHDMTARRSLEEQYRQSQKMEAIGRLAGGVAHDFNNLLTVITGYGQLLLRSLPLGDPSRDLIREMTTAGDRAAGLTRQLLAFSRKAIIEPKVLDLKAVVANMNKMLRRVIGEDVELVTEADADVGQVKADPSHVEQVILNLVVNARDAMPRGGRLTIAVRNVALDVAYANAHPGSRPGPHILLAVSDTGCGIDAATMARLFEPFFTTKGELGTGLGLATVYGVVQQSGGHVTVESEPGQGAVFKVYLPAVRESPTLRKSEPGRSSLPRGQETILLVEDEDGVRALTKHILKQCGYTVLEARDGLEALRLAASHAGSIDMLVTDVVMPHMGGRELSELMAAQWPRTKVLFLSGYTDDDTVRHGVREAEVSFLQKPFSPPALAQKVREVLEG